MCSVVEIGEVLKRWFRSNHFHQSIHKLLFSTCKQHIETKLPLQHLIVSGPRFTDLKIKNKLFPTFEGFVALYERLQRGRGEREREREGEREREREGEREREREGERG